MPKRETHKIGTTAITRTHERFVEQAVPVIHRWFSELPTASENFVFDQYDAEDLANKLAASLLTDGTATKAKAARKQRRKATK